MTAPTAGVSFRADIEGLRAVAVAAVLAAHLADWPSGGFIGVDVFFVISGFLITGLLLREVETTGTVRLRAFWVRRIRRLLPAAAVVLAVTVAASLALLPLSRAIQTAIDAGWSALVVSNWRFAAVGTDYFQEGRPPSPVQNFWTLSVEEQFYLVWPALIIVLVAVVARAWPGVTIRRVVGATAAAVVVGSLCWATYESWAQPTVAYFSTFSRAWELAVGALVACVSPWLPKMNANARSVMSSVGLGGIAVSAIVISPEFPFPSPWALLPVASAALVIVAGIGGPVRSPLLTNRASRLLGRMSYSLYLWHWPVLVLAIALAGEGWLTTVSALVVTAGAAAGTYFFIEAPVRRGRWLEKWAEPTPRSRSMFVAGALTATIGLVIATVGATTVLDRWTSSRLPSNPIIAEPCFGAAAVLSGSSCEPIVDLAELTPSVDHAADDTQGAYSCWRPEGGELRACSYGAEDPLLRLALVGDSHAAMLLPGLVGEAIARGWSIDSYVGFGCQWTASGRGDCVDVRSEIQDILLREGYDAVVTTASRSVGSEDVAESAANYAAAWQPVADAGSVIVVVADNPSVDQSALDCLARAGDAPGALACATDRLAALARPDPLPVASQLVDGSVLVDFTDAYCLEARCPAVVGGVIVYRDAAGHLTGTFSLTLGPFLADRIESDTIPEPSSR